MPRERALPWGVTGMVASGVDNRGGSERSEGGGDCVPDNKEKGNES